MNGFLIFIFFGTDTTNNNSLVAFADGEYILNMVDSLECRMSSDTTIITFNSLNSAGSDAMTSLCLDEPIDLNTLLSADADPNGEWRDADNNMIVPNGLFAGSSVTGSFSYWYIVMNEMPCPPDTASITVEVLDSNLDAGQDVAVDLCFEDNIDLNTLVNGNPGGFIVDAADQEILNTVLSNVDLVIGTNLYRYIIDGNNCGSDTAMISIDLLSPIDITRIEGPFCEDEIITIENTDYDINNAQDQILLASANGCDSLIEIDLQFFTPAQSIFQETFCQDDVVDIGGVTFTFMDPDGTVVLENASSNQCDSIIEVDLTFLNSIDTLIQLELCDNESITINNQVYDINNPDDMIVLANGSSQGCDSTIVVDLSFAASIQEDINMDLCEGESIMVNGMVYDITMPSGVEMLQSSSGCDSIVNIDLNFNFNSTETIEMMICDNESVQIEGDVYDQNNLSGTTLLSIPNQFGCDSIVSVNLTHFTSDMMMESVEACIGDSLFLDGQWIFTNGIYIENLTNQNGCDSLIETTASFIDCTVNVDFSVTDLVCFDDGSGEVSFEIGNYNNYPMDISLADLLGNVVQVLSIDNDGPHVIDNLDSGSYLLLGSNSGTPLFGITLDVMNADPITFSTDTSDPNCVDSNDGSISVNPSGGNGTLSVDWNTGQTGDQLVDLVAGDYSFTVTDDSGCSVEGASMLTAPSGVSFDLSIQDATCSGITNGQVDIDLISGNGLGLNYSLDGQTFQQSSLFTDLEEGTYNYYVQDDNLCIYESSFTINSLNTNAITANEFLSISLGDTIAFEAMVNFTANTISWTPATGLSCSDCLNPLVFSSTNTIYTLFVEDENGCQAQHVLNVTVDIPDVSPVYMPNVFNPNSLENRTFLPILNPNLSIQPSAFRIFDRWGNLVHEEINELNGWNGFVDNTQPEIGVYVYTFEYIFNGESFQMLGDVLLLK